MQTTELAFDIRTYVQSYGLIAVEAVLYDVPIGKLVLDGPDGIVPGYIEWVTVDQEFRRCGVARSLFEYATENPDIPTPIHSQSLSPSGRAWAYAVGGKFHVNHENFK